jgi:hypothetical protein
MARSTIMKNLASLAAIILMTVVAALSAFTKSKEQVQAKPWQSGSEA